MTRLVLHVHGLFVLTAVSACLPALDLPPGAQLACAADGDCPTGTLCIGATGDGDGDDGLCVSADSPCINASGAPVGDGTPCGDGVCTAGVCRARGCGDGVVDTGAGEECDPVANSVCRDNCTVPFCGDGIVDPDESCDRTSPDCRDCVLLCIGAFVDINQPVERRSNCDLDSDNGCECDLAPVFDLGDGGFVWHSELAADGAVYFTVYQDGNRSLARFHDGVVTEVLEDMNLMSLAVEDGVPYILFDDFSGEAQLARVDGTTIDILRGGLTTGDGIDFIVDGDDLTITNGNGLFRASVLGEDALAFFSDGCSGLTDLVLCDGRFYCSDADAGFLRSVDVDTGVGVDVYRFDPADKAPRLLCHEGAAVVHDVGALFVVDDNVPVLLARFATSGTNFDTPLFSLDRNTLVLNEAFGAAGPYGHLYSLSTGRLTPVVRGFPLASDGVVMLTDDSRDDGVVGLLRLTPP